MRGLGSWLREDLIRFPVSIIVLVGLNLAAINLLEGAVLGAVALFVTAAAIILTVAYIIGGRAR